MKPFSSTSVHAHCSSTPSLTAPILVGSLLKPFLALAYGGTHATPYPTITCNGHADRCWKPHGSITLTEAIAQSCNAYFLALARTIPPSAIPYLPPAPANASPETLIGLTPGWLIAPSDLALAYATLLTAPQQATQTPAHSDVLAGMQGSALRGTAALIGPHPGGVLAKTGTASCIDPHCRATGDGLLIAAFPAREPTLLLFLRKRATTGAQTARAAGPILNQLKALHAY